MTTVVTAGLSDAEVAQRVADGKTNDVPTRAARSVSDIVRGQRLHPDQRDPRRAARHRAVHRLGDQRPVRSADHRQQRDRHHPGTARQADPGQAGHRRAGETVGAQAIRDRGASRPTRWCSTTSSSSVRATRSSSTATSLEETNLEVDESLLTGEADPIAKDAGDKVMSGSFVVAGSGAYRATKVGREAYAAKLAEEASKFTLVKSELRTGINKILQFITYLLLPAGAADHLHAAVHHRARAGGSRCCGWSARWCRWCPRAWC